MVASVFTGEQVDEEAFVRVKEKVKEALVRRWMKRHL